MTIRITWSDPNGPLTQEEEVRIYRHTAPFDVGSLPAVLATLAADVESYDDATAVADTSYWYAVGFEKDGRLKLDFTSIVYMAGTVFAAPVTFGSGTVLLTGQNLSGTVFSDAASFGGGAISSGPVTVSGSLFSSAAVFGSGSVTVSIFSPPIVMTLVNPGAEAGNASGWTAASGGSLWTSSDIITIGYPPVIYAGSRYFTAGSIANARMYQDIDVSTYADAIDAGSVVAEFTARFAGATNFGDYFSMFVRALDNSNVVISSVAQEELTAKELASGWYLQDLNMILPSGTRKVRIEVHATRVSGAENDVHFDAATLTLFGASKRITPTYGHSISRGNRTSSITLTTTNLTMFGTLSALVDGTLANGPYFNGATNDGTSWLTFDFGSGNAYVIDEFMWKQQNTTSHGVWRLEGSNNNSSWTQIGSDFTLTSGLIQPGGANTTAYRYYRLRAMSGARSSGPYLYEIQFRARSA